MRTLRNMRSSGCFATQSWRAVHFPMPPFAAKRVQRESSLASMVGAGAVGAVTEEEGEGAWWWWVVAMVCVVVVVGEEERVEGQERGTDTQLGMEARRDERRAVGSGQHAIQVPTRSTLAYPASQPPASRSPTPISVPFFVFLFFLKLPATTCNYDTLELEHHPVASGHFPHPVAASILRVSTATPSLAPSLAPSHPPAPPAVRTSS